MAAAAAAAPVVQAPAASAAGAAPAAAAAAAVVQLEPAPPAAGTAPVPPEVAAEAAATAADAGTGAAAAAAVVADSNGVNGAAVVVADSVPSAEADASDGPAPDLLVDDSTYGLFVDPAGSFDAARAATKRLHETLGALKLAKSEAEAEGGSGFVEMTRELQLQLLAIRRAHRAMAKAASVGRATEAAARRVADAEFAHLETRRYESACCRAAARRCRTFPTPQLSKLSPFLGEGGAGPVDGQEEEEEEESAANDGAATGLARRLEAERLERAKLSEELEALEKRMAADLEAFREQERLSSELASRLRAAELALEPVCDLLELRPRPGGATPPPGLSRLPVPLQLVFAKFEVLAAFGADAGVSVQLEAGGSVEVAGPKDGEPPEKKPRLEGAGAVKVSIAFAPGRGKNGPAATLNFSCTALAAGGGAALVGVQGEGIASEALLEGLWPEDDGRVGPLVAAAAAAGVAGKAFGWAQVLAGLRDKAVPLLAGSSTGGPLSTGASVTAGDVVQRLRARLASPV